MKKRRCSDGFGRKIVAFFFDQLLVDSTFQACSCDIYMWILIELPFFLMEISEELNSRANFIQNCFQKSQNLHPANFQSDFANTRVLLRKMEVLPKIGPRLPVSEKVLHTD